jgi:hypothetical protein
MSETIATQVTLVSTNEVSDEDAERVMEKYDADSLEEVAQEMEETVESHLAHRAFGGADNIPILDVDTTVYEDWSEDDVTDLRE